MLIRRYSFLALTFLLLLSASNVATLQSPLEAELWRYACALESNSSLKYEYYSSVRSQYGNRGNPQDDDRYVALSAGLSRAVQCYSGCKNVALGNVTWCVYIYHPKESIRICLNNSGVIVETPSAALLGLREILSIQLCPGSSSLGCLWVTQTPYYFKNAYFVCTTRNTSCVRHTFTEIEVQGIGKDIKITEFPGENVIVSQGKTSILKCVSLGTSALNYLQWTRNNYRNYTAIYENPFCSTTESGICNQYNASVGLQLERVRMYVVVTSTEGCIPVTNIVSYLIIDNATEGDEGVYTCTAFSNPLLLSQMDRKETVSVILHITKEEPTDASSSTYTHFNVSGGVMNSTETHVEKYSSNVYLYALTICCLAMVATALFSTALIIQRWRCWRRKLIMHIENPYHESTDDGKSASKCIPSDPWRFPEQKLTIFRNRVLGKGAFGKVLLARAEGIIPETPEKDIVAVKTTKDGVCYYENNDLFDELELMKKLKPHENIINLLGYSIIKGCPPCLIIEYALHGSLRSFLKSCREAALSLNHQPVIVRSRARTESYSSTSSSQELLSTTSPTCGHTFSFSRDNSQKHSPDTHKLQCASQDSGYDGSVDLYLEEERVVHHTGTAIPVAHSLAPIMHDYINCKGLVHMEDVENFALQIASGLKHLTKMEIVHCDLAARNILIGDGFVLKISDFGMARDISGKEYYKKSQKGHIPVKWTSPEALSENIYTFKSDTWSFGVVLWEIFTYGQTPYPDFEINSVEPFIQYLKDGNRLPRPDGCPESIYNIMQKCWDWDPNNRPSSCQLMDAFIPSHCNQSCSSSFIRQSQEISTLETSGDVFC